jgi:hypothetical protein
LSVGKVVLGRYQNRPGIVTVTIPAVAAAMVEPTDASTVFRKP